MIIPASQQHLTKAAALNPSIELDFKFKSQGLTQSRTITSAVIEEAVQSHEANSPCSKQDQIQQFTKIIFEELEALELENLSEDDPTKIHLIKEPYPPSDLTLKSLIQAVIPAKAQDEWLRYNRMFPLWRQNLCVKETSWVPRECNARVRCLFHSSIKDNPSNRFPIHQLIGDTQDSRTEQISHWNEFLIKFDTLISEIFKLGTLEQAHETEKVSNYQKHLGIRLKLAFCLAILFEGTNRNCLLAPTEYNIGSYQEYKQSLHHSYAASAQAENFDSWIEADLLDLDLNELGDEISSLVRFNFQATSSEIPKTHQLSRISNIFSKGLFLENFLKDYKERHMYGEPARTRIRVSQNTDLISLSSLLSILQNSTYIANPQLNRLDSFIEDMLREDLTSKDPQKSQFAKLCLSSEEESSTALTSYITFVKHTIVSRTELSSRNFMAATAILERNVLGKLKSLLEKYRSQLSALKELQGKQFEIKTTIHEESISTVQNLVKRAHELATETKQLKIEANRIQSMAEKPMKIADEFAKELYQAENLIQEIELFLQEPGDSLDQDLSQKYQRQLLRAKINISDLIISSLELDLKDLQPESPKSLRPLELEALKAELSAEKNKGRLLKTSQKNLVSQTATHLIEKANVLSELQDLKADCSRLSDLIPHLIAKTTSPKAEQLREHSTSLLEEHNFRHEELKELKKQIEKAKKQRYIKAFEQGLQEISFFDKIKDLNEFGEEESSLITLTASFITLNKQAKCSFSSRLLNQLDDLAKRVKLILAEGSLKNNFLSDNLSSAIELLKEMIFLIETNGIKAINEDLSEISFYDVINQNLEEYLTSEIDPLITLYNKLLPQEKSYFKHFLVAEILPKLSEAPSSSLNPVFNFA